MPDTPVPRPAPVDLDAVKAATTLSRPGPVFAVASPSGRREARLSFGGFEILGTGYSLWVEEVHPPDLVALAAAANLIPLFVADLEATRAERDADHVLAAELSNFTIPALKREIAEGDACLRDTRTELIEARATLAAERGDAAGALPGWEWRVGQWSHGEGDADAYIEHSGHAPATSRPSPPPWRCSYKVNGRWHDDLRAWTAREGMRLVLERLERAPVTNHRDDCDQGRIGPIAFRDCSCCKGSPWWSSGA